MPEQHRAVTEWSPRRFISWAAKTGDKTKAYISWLLEQPDHPERAYKTCAGILRLAAGVSTQQMELAASTALSRNVFSFRYFKTLLNEIVDVPPSPIRHEHIRGNNYYREEHHDQ
jgi:hypothetical protein